MAFENKNKQLHILDFFPILILKQNSVLSNKQTALFEKHSEFVDVGWCDEKLTKQCGWLKNIFWKMRQI